MNLGNFSTNLVDLSSVGDTIKHMFIQGNQYYNLAKYVLFLLNNLYTHKIKAKSLVSCAL